MKERIDTIPVIEAFDAGDECPFCYLERQTEQKAIRYTAGPGASYMEPDVREVTDKLGFCGHHMQKLFDYGNSLGNALMMQTYYVGLIKELQNKIENFSIPKKSLFGKKEAKTQDSIADWATRRGSSCFLCDKIEYSMARYYHTFFYLLKEADFRQKVAGSKGFCMRHFARLMTEAETQLPSKQAQWFYDTVFSLMKENLARVQEDLDWFVQKFDYRNASADWKNSKDAVSRGMQKLQGIYPADEPYKQN